MALKAFLSSLHKRAKLIVGIGAADVVHYKSMDLCWGEFCQIFIHRVLNYQMSHTLLYVRQWNTCIRGKESTH